MAGNGRVYLIYNDDDDLLYVGSTELTLEERHRIRRYAMRYAYTPDYSASVNTHYRRIGPTKMKLELLEEVVFESKDELRWCERAWMETFEGMGFELLNDQQPIRSEEERKAYHDAYNRHHHEQHKDDPHRREQLARARQSETGRAQQKRWREENRDHLRAAFKAWGSERIPCPICGKTVTRAKKARHVRDKHSVV